MKKKHRIILNRLIDSLNKLGGELDGTATNEAKYRDRQRAHRHSYQIIYAILADHPENDQTLYDFERAEDSLKALEALTIKDYPDRKGTY